ncbi:MAG TPA: hypothetical protein VJ184_13210 [Chryseolinea sp.]|nr:hypothetical protein [Chryseolinea sp.]
MRTLTFLFLLICTFSFSQPTSYGNFKVSEQEIIYQKIVPLDSITPGKLEAYYKTLPYISGLKVIEGGVEFLVNDLVIDYKKFQFTQVNTPSIIQTGRYSGSVEVGVKDGKYRITFHSIQLTGDIGYKKILEKDNLTSYACKNNGTVLAQDWCRPNMLGLLDQAFTDKLQYVEPKKKKNNDDW